MQLIGDLEIDKRSDLDPVPDPLKVQALLEACKEAGVELASTNIEAGESVRRVQLNDIDNYRSLESDGRQWHCMSTCEHFLECGSGGVSDLDLLEILLSIAQPGASTRAVAKQLVTEFGSIGNVLTAQPLLVKKMPGIQLQSIALLKLVHTAAVRLARSEVKNRPILSNWHALVGYLNAVLAREQVEQVRVLFLDNKLRLMVDEVMWRGTVNHVPVYPSEIVRRALELQCRNIILTHNHPSGDPTPSQEDITMTQQVAAAAKTLSMVVYDHVIIGNGTWVSLRKEGFLESVPDQIFT